MVVFQHQPTQIVFSGGIFSQECLKLGPLLYLST